jgi:hypothetical protein
VLARRIYIQTNGIPTATFLVIRGAENVLINNFMELSPFSEALQELLSIL